MGTAAKLAFSPTYSECGISGALELLDQGFDEESVIGQTCTTRKRRDFERGGSMGEDDGVVGTEPWKICVLDFDSAPHRRSCLKKPIP